MKFLVLWSGLCCYTEGWGGKCSEILATIKLLYNPRVNKVFTSLFTIGEILVKFFFFFFASSWTLHVAQSEDLQKKRIPIFPQYRPITLVE